VRNVESKFRCVDHEGVARRALVAGARDEGLIRQRDQFYRVPHGRLKLRTTGNERCELIAYQRDDAPGARASDYARHATTNAASLDELLGRALPRAGVLEKTRHLLIHGNTNIHLDDVVGLGRFVELETVIHDQTETDAQREHLDVVEALGLGEAERISVAYVDLLNPQAESSSALSRS
jgi:adenylate cyclase class IV